MTAIGPLHIIDEHPFTGRKILVWKNRRPTSPGFCSPIRMQFAKDINELITQTINSIQIQIDNLQFYERVCERKIISVNSKLCLTMIGRKVCNALSECISE